MIRFFIFGTILWFNFCWSQEYRSFNPDYHFKVTSDLEVIPTIDSMKTFIVHFKSNDVENVEKTLLNNPQIKELQLYNPPQSFILTLNTFGLDSLHYLLIEDYKDSILIFNKLSIKLVAVDSKELRKINIRELDTSALQLIGIEAENLVVWEANPSYPFLGLIDLRAPQLTVFPIIDMPSIRQFVFDCSLKEMPLNLCSYPELKFISLQNNRKIKVNNCLKKKIREGVYSNVTILDSIDGKIIYQVHSKDKSTDNY